MISQVPLYEEFETAMEERHTPELHKKLKNAVVGVAGLGGLGSNIAIILARLGIGKLILADFDCVELLNLNRQQYFIKHIGMKKCDAIKEIIKEINPYIHIVTYNQKIDEKNALEIFSECSIVCEAFDNPDSKAMLVNTIMCKSDKIKLIASSGMAGYEICNDIVTRKINDRFYLCGDGISGAEKGRSLMAPRVAVCAGHQANQVIRLIAES